MLLLIILFIHGLSVYHVLTINVDNNPAILGEFPYHVSIQNLGSSYHHCGGIIIDPNYVLTAAHCIDRLEPEDFQIVDGTVNLAKKNKSVHIVLELMPHEGYNSSDSWINDIGLIKVQQPFQFNTATNQANLPQASSIIPAGTNATVIGFGRTDLNSFTSRVLQKTEVTVKDISYCNEKYQKAGWQFKNTQICAQSLNGTGICKGDSDGAFIVDGTVVGISSFTNSDCDHLKYPSIFTKISEYTIWIDKQMGKYEKSKL